MSYCRWSSDDFQCDVYVYEDVSGGWTCHVASQRLPKTKLPAPIPWDDDFNKAWLRQEEVKEILDILREADCWVQLTGPYAGTTHNVETPGECATLLEAIRASGLNVPQYAIDSLREEEEERSTI